MRYTQDMNKTRAASAGFTLMAAIPPAKGLTDHPESAAVALGAAADDAGGWVYNNVGADARYGSVVVNCTHTDTKGSVWTEY